MRRAEITVFFSLLFPLLLALLMVSLESAYQQAMRSQVQRSLVLCEDAFLSEYQRELWEQYGLFYLDTAYGKREESEKTVKARLLFYLQQNLSRKDGGTQSVFAPFGAAVSDLRIGSFSRMTDGRGMGFYEQAVAFEQDLWGGRLLTEWNLIDFRADDLEELGQDYEEAEKRERRNLEVLRQRRLEEEEQDTEDPMESLRSEAAEGLLEMVLKTPEQLSFRTVSGQNIPSERVLLEGTGCSGRYPGNAGNDQWFHTYLLERFSNAKEISLAEKSSGSWLAYELEYIIAGGYSDRENLETVLERLLLLREGANYAYLLTDEEKKQQAYLLAAAIAGITMLPELVDALQQVILLGWAYGESVLDIRGLLQGSQVTAWKTEETWKLPLSQLFLLKNHLEEYDGRTDAGGLSYESYLRLFLTLTKRQEKCMRGLDVIEGNLRKTKWGQNLYVDQCIDGLLLQVDLRYPELFAPRAAGREETQGMVYITDYGNRYHQSLECGGLKRTIRLVSLSEVHGKHPCSGCSSGG